MVIIRLILHPFFSPIQRRTSFSILNLIKNLKDAILVFKSAPSVTIIFYHNDSLLQIRFELIQEHLKFGIIEFALRREFRHKSVGKDSLPFTMNSLSELWTGAT
jgi:hypothetical protein